jgi:hypothetical protein
LEIESDSRYRKDKELANMASLTKPMSQLNFEISPILISLVGKKAGKVSVIWHSSRVYMIYVLRSNFCSMDGAGSRPQHQNFYLIPHWWFCLSRNTAELEHMSRHQQRADNA